MFSRTSAATMRVLMVLRQGRRISTYPTVFNAARLWKETGAIVDIITVAEADIHDVFTEFVSISNLGFLAQKLMIFRQMKRNKYDIVIGYEPIDAELLALFPNIFKAFYIYHNIELRYFSNWKFFIHNRLERKFYDRCQLIICQDEIRMRELKCLLGRENEESNKKFAYVPNTYMRKEIPVDNQYLQCILSIPNDKKILLYSGAIQKKKIPKNVILHILNVMPENWCLVLSGWSAESYAEQLSLEIGEKSRLYIHSNTLDESNYLKFVTSATAALIWYVGNDPNEYNMGLSSGKFWRFLTLGKSSIVVDLPGLGNFAKKAQAGVVVNNIEELNTADFAILEKSVKVLPEYFYEYHYSKVLDYVKRKI